MPRLTKQEQQEIIRYLEAYRPLPENCTAIGNLDHYLRQDCDIIAI